MKSATVNLLRTTPTYAAWKKIGLTHHHGLCLPLSSLWTAHSSGIGEFYDLVPLIDWCAQLGFDLIQILPINDSGLDPSPYNALSSCALHPIYLSLHALPYLDQAPHLRDRLAHFHYLKFTKRVRYAQVLALKQDWLRRYVTTLKDPLLADPQLDRFLREETALQEYALFKALKARYRQTDWREWPPDIQHPSHLAMKRLRLELKEPIEHEMICQYLCCQQMKRMKHYSEERGVFLKGDIPILISPDSSDVWAHRSLFDLTRSAGVPPTEQEPHGQYWGFPLYNWEAMRQDHHAWWKRRLLHAKQFYHLYRIDHIPGFFRLWSIPRGSPPSAGCYQPIEQSLMEMQGRELLKLFVETTDMLPIGEDLGDVPHFVRRAMADYGICSTKVMRLERDRHDQPISPSDYPPLSLSTLSTHDMAPMRLFSLKPPKQLASHHPHLLTPDEQYGLLHSCHHSASIFHINLIQEYLALVPELTFSDPADEQINYPGTQFARNWSYRLKQSLETLTTSDKLARKMASIVAR